MKNEVTAVVKYQSSMNRVRKGSRNLHREIMSEAMRDIGDPNRSTPFWDEQLQQAQELLGTAQ